MGEQRLRDVESVQGDDVLLAGERDRLAEYPEPDPHLGSGWRTGGQRTFQDREICAFGLVPRLVGHYWQRPFLSRCRRCDLSIVYQGFATDAQPKDCRVLCFRFGRAGKRALFDTDSRFWTAVVKLGVLLAEGWKNSK